MLLCVFLAKPSLAKHPIGIGAFGAVALSEVATVLLLVDPLFLVVKPACQLVAVAVGSALGWGVSSAQRSAA